MRTRDNTSAEIVGIRLHIKGRVQGVGFRPFIYRLAMEHKLAGSVFNRPDGVIVEIEGRRSHCSKFIRDISFKHPPAAVIKEVKQYDVEIVGRHEFQILPSEKNNAIITDICPDIAVCKECLDEMNSTGRRKGYPLINCTNCGPRFTLIQDYPYDRNHTTMNAFTMCPACKTEYNDPNDRRFHAQPTSCFHCGPKYELHYQDEIITDFNDIIRIGCQHIDSGKVIAIKGLGGYNLVCDATNKTAVDEIRKFKKRERKPFAVMFDSLESIRKICDINDFEATALTSWRRPIVILDHQNKSYLTDSITAGLSSLGVFLPYLPLHHLLFNGIRTGSLVITSGNESDVPILYRESKALYYFRSVSGGIIINNRKIARRADDSVIRVIDQKPQLMRRARGFVPAPVDLAFNVDGILATGAELSNAFCLGKQQLAILSQHIGDLKNAETFEFFCENIDNFKRMYHFDPQHIACDLHPDYLSTVYANDSGLPVTHVQHHHAHIAAVMAEHGLYKKIIGLAYDGTGYGTDGYIWGSELLISDLFDFHRESHFEYIPLPGGDLVTKEPWRTGLSYIYKTFGEEWDSIDIPLVKNIDLKNASRLIQAIDKQINCPLSCSAGRLFDAVAAILGICTESNYHAEAPLLLENYLIDDIHGEYSTSGNGIVSFSPMIREIINDLYQGTTLNEIVTKFHNSIARVAFNQVNQASEKYQIKNVALSGGSFQNKYLTEKLLLLLRQKDLTIYFSKEVSCNDGGIALGQLAVAAHKK